MRASHCSVLLFYATSTLAAAPLPVLKPSDVVFMYQAPKKVYQDYGATVLAWGGTPDPRTLEEAADLKFFGSVGMVTEFSRYFERFPEKYETGLCRDLQGKPYKVPWLTDHTHKGVPYWWCCTRQPVFRQYISERVVQTVKAGADGVHIDDHLGTAGSLFVGGGCFCERCMVEFRDELKPKGAAEVKDPASYNFPEEARAWLGGQTGRRVEGHPLWPRWRDYQLRGAAAFMEELRALAAKTAGREVPMSANAGLLWGSHLNDYTSLDFFSAEIDHHANSKRFSDAPVVAYRIADAVERPLASTASGGDWAFIKEQARPGLVRGWIALGYAAGHSLMAPNRQWCYTKEKGTHWYEGPSEKFAPIYRFVRERAELFDGYRACADVTIAYSQRSYDRNPNRLVEVCGKLSAANLIYDLALGGDEVVRHRLPEEQLRRARRVLVVDAQDFSPEDQVTLTISPAQQVGSIEEAIDKAARCLRVQGENLRVLPRTKPGSAVAHVLNWAYNFETDQTTPRKAVEVRLDLEALGVHGATEAEWFAPAAKPLCLPVRDGMVVIPELDLWGLIRVQRR